MLRKLISSPRNRHNDELSSTSLDLAYLTPNLIVMSTPASSFPKNLWRNPVEDVRKFLDANHKDNWWVWSLRGEGSDYFDKDLEGKVSHSGWPDHHPPPFEYMGPILASIHKHLSSNPKATAVLHCKAGKGRSGTIAVSYLITYSNWDANKALQHFTIQRMRIGEGVSIASQRRWVRYVDFWANTLERTYKPRTVRICKIEFWGMRIMDQGDKIEVGIAGFQDGARVGSKEVDKIHVFEDDERTFDSDKATYIPRKEIIVNADVNMFLTRHRLLHVSERIPKIPMSISHCWINTTLEKEKLRHGDTGYKEPVEVVSPTALK